MFAGDASARGGVLTVGDDQIRVMERCQRLDMTLDEVATRPRDDIADKEEFHEPAASDADTMGT